MARRFHLQEKLAADTEGVFNSAFFEKLLGVCTAVDDSASRLYIDARCVAFGKPMVDGGKLGTKGSVQVKHCCKIRCLESVVPEAGFCWILVRSIFMRNSCPRTYICVRFCRKTFLRSCRLWNYFRILIGRSEALACVCLKC